MKNVHFKTPAPERRLLVESFETGKYSALVNCGSFSLPPVAGANTPNLDYVIVVPGRAMDRPGRRFPHLTPCLKLEKAIGESDL